MEGFLNKQGEKGLVLNLWRKRWFQLDPVAQRMYYYKTKGKEELLGYINLAEANEVVSTEPKDSFSFSIQTRDRVWNLSASSEIDKRTWMSAIEKSIRRPSTTVRGSAVQNDVNTSSPTSGKKNSEYLGIFEFEGEDGDSRMPGSSLQEESELASSKALTFEMDEEDDYDDDKMPAPPRPTPMEDRSFLCGSLPVNVPKMASTWQANPTWTFAQMDGEDDDGGFVQPHEMAARTYKEMTLQTGLDFNRPRSHSKRLQAFI